MGSIPPNPHFLSTRIPAHGLYSKGPARGYRYNRDGIVRMEVVILQSLQWRTDELTPLHFVDHFLALRCVGAYSLRPHLRSHPVYSCRRRPKLALHLR